MVAVIRITWRAYKSRVLGPTPEFWLDRSWLEAERLLLKEVPRGCPGRWSTEHALRTHRTVHFSWVWSLWLLQALPSPPPLSVWTLTSRPRPLLCLLDSFSSSVTLSSFFWFCFIKVWLKANSFPWVLGLWGSQSEQSLPGWFLFIWGCGGLRVVSQRRGVGLRHSRSRTKPCEGLTSHYCWPLVSSGAPGFSVLMLRAGSLTFLPKRQCTALNSQ